jgi:hypothetical protein
MLTVDGRRNALRNLAAPQIAGGLLAVVALIALMLLSGGRGQAQTPEPWPSFVMVYRDTVGSALAADPPTTQTFRLVYTDRRNFVSTVLAHSKLPSGIGYTQTVSATRSSVVDPRFGTVQSAAIGPDEPRTVPSDWLVPAKSPSISAIPDATSVIGLDGLTTTTLVQSAGGRRIVEQLVYRTADGIPVRFIQSVNGIETRHTEVLELTITTK